MSCGFFPNLGARDERVRWKGVRNIHKSFGRPSWPRSSREGIERSPRCVRRRAWPRRPATNWVQRCGTVTTHPTQRGHRQWTAEAKLKALVETAGVAEDELGLYLRREGLSSHQITAWRAAVLAHVTTSPPPKKDARDETIRQLEPRSWEKTRRWPQRPRCAFSKEKSTRSGGTDTRPQRDRVGSKTGAGVCG